MSKGGGDLRCGWSDWWRGGPRLAREGAMVFLAGRTQAKLDMVVDDIRARGGGVNTRIVDALTE